MVLLIWGTFILGSPIFGRIGCGWFCFMGTTFDMAGSHAIIKKRWRKPKMWIRLIALISFFASSVTFYYLNSLRGISHGFAFDPGFLTPIFDAHYKIVWICDVFFGLILSLFLSKRWLCKLCFVGTLCSLGAQHSRLIPVVDQKKCTTCNKCDLECPTNVPLLHYIKNNRGMITDSECILCGKCLEVCRSKAVKMKFVWNRARYAQEN